MAALVVLFHVISYDSLPTADPASAHRWLYRSPLTRIGDFILGICGAVIYARERDSVRLVKAAPLVAAAMSVSIVVLMAIPRLLNSAPSYDLAYAVPGAVLILALALAPGRGVARVLGSVAFVALGELSYAFYLIHVPVGGQVHSLGVSGEGFTARGVTVLLVCVVILIGLSWLLHVSFERPARVFLRRRLSITDPKQ